MNLKDLLKRIKIIRILGKSFSIFKDEFCEQFSTPFYFLNNSTESENVCFILAGYKEITWEIIFKRIKKFAPKDIDICIVSSGLYNERLNNIAIENKWSYITTKRNCVTLALNTAIKNFPAAKYIYKIDEDIFITKGFFESLKDCMNLSKKDYFPAFVAPLIPINGYGYRRILEKFNKTKLYEDKFEYPKIATDVNMMIQKNPDAAKFFWNEEIFMNIDKMNDFLASKPKEYTVCPIRFSIGAILFEKEILEKYGYFPVRNNKCMGVDEVYICNLATKYSRAIIVCENNIAGHLSFGRQNQAMEDFFIKNKNIFDIQEQE